MIKSSIEKADHSLKVYCNRISVMKTSPFCVIALSCFPIFFPLLEPRLFWSHEGGYLLWRLASFHQNVIHFTPFCRWFQDFARGFGLPVLEFFPVFPLYVAEVFRFSGFSTIISIKLLIVTMTLFSAWGAFLFGKETWGETGGIITAVLYSYAPYKMVNLYVRGDLNEYMAMSIAPWIFWMVLRSTKMDKPSLLSLSTILAFSLPAISHYPSCVIHYPAYCIWILLLSFTARNTRRYLIRNTLSLALALLLTSTFWASAFFSRHLVQMEGMTRGFADYSQHFIRAGQWFSFYWNYGASVAGPGDAISFQVGNLALITTIPGIRRLLQYAGIAGSGRTVVVSALTICALSLILTHPSSAFIWSSLPILPLLQFPYRLLVLPALMTAFIAGVTGSWIDHRLHQYRWCVMIPAILIIIGSSLHMCRAAAFLDLDEDDLTPERIRRIAHTHSTGEFIPIQVGKRFPPLKPVAFTIEKIPETGFSRQQTEERLARMLQSSGTIETWEDTAMHIGESSVVPGQADVLAGELTVSDPVISPCGRKLRINALTDGLLRVNVFYLEAWSAFIDQTPLPIEPDPATGMILARLPRGDYIFMLKYKNLPLSRTLGLVGLLTIPALFLIRFSGKRNHV